MTRHALRLFYSPGRRMHPLAYELVQLLEQRSQGVLAMGQSTLLLDEPTSQLDPIAAEELLALVTRINRDRGITVVLYRSVRTAPDAGQPAQRCTVT